MPDPDPQTPVTVQGQFDWLSGQFTLQFVASYTDGRSLSQLSSSWGTTTIMSAPQLQWTPTAPLGPAQFAVVSNAINQAWPTLGPMAIETSVQVGFATADGTPAASIAPQVDVKLGQTRWLDIQGSLQIQLAPDGAGGLAVSASVPTSVQISGGFTF
jgi:hypothetical protein